MADRVLLKIVCLLMRWLFGLVFRGDWTKNAELLVLRHENAVLRQNAGRVRYEPADRVWFAVLTRFIPRRRWAEVFPVTPATLLAWHHRLAATARTMTPDEDELAELARLRKHFSGHRIRDVPQDRGVRYAAHAVGSAIRFLADSTEPVGH